MSLFMKNVAFCYDILKVFLQLNVFRYPFPYNGLFIYMLPIFPANIFFIKAYLQPVDSQKRLTKIG